MFQYSLIVYRYILFSKLQEDFTTYFVLSGRQVESPPLLLLEILK